MAVRHPAGKENKRSRTDAWDAGILGSFSGLGGCIYGALGDKDKAFAALEKAFEAHDWDLFRLKVDPMFADLRGDARYSAMLKRLNLPE